MRRRAGVFLAMVLALAVAATAASASTTRIPSLYKSCSHLNARYPHSVTRAGARDHVTSGDPVTTFLRSTRIYNLAMHYNRGLDRDQDGVACEKQ